METILEVIFKALAHAFEHGLDPVAEVRKALEADPRIDTSELERIVADVEAKLP